MSDMKKPPIVVERYADNGELSHYDLIDSETQETLWSGENTASGKLDRQKSYNGIGYYDRVRKTIE